MCVLAVVYAASLGWHGGGGGEGLVCAQVGKVGKVGREEMNRAVKVRA